MSICEVCAESTGRDVENDFYVVQKGLFLGPLCFTCYTEFNSADLTID